MRGPGAERRPLGGGFWLLACSLSRRGDCRLAGGSQAGRPGWSGLPARGGHRLSGRLEGQVALVTGSSRGIGEAIVSELDPQATVPGDGLPPGQPDGVGQHWPGGQERA